MPDAHRPQPRPDTYLRPEPASLTDRVKAFRPKGLDWALGLPLLAAAAWLAGYEAIGMALALGLPAVLLLSGRGLYRTVPEAPAKTVLSKREAQILAQRVLEDCDAVGRGTIALLARVERPAMGGADWDRKAGDKAMATLLRRVAATMRDGDAVFYLGDETIATILHPTRRADLDIGINIADRLQAAVAEPLSIGGRTIRVDCKVGLCTDAMASERTGEALLLGATCALREAERHEAGAVRAFTREMQREVDTGHRLTLQVEQALEDGQIRPWFQPQVDARTGQLSGFEALARWYHPELGVLAPAQFLPAIDASGNGAALGERMLRDSLDALKAWDDAGLIVHHVGVNFSMEELRDPRLAERVIWEVDRQSIAPSRIAVEIMETVTLDGADETISRNIRCLKDAGMRLDLDDFGTGAAAIRNIAEFGVHRIKIDRSFVVGLEYSSDKRRILTAILSLASEMGIETLAEGVETKAQGDTLTALGCTQLQGYGVAKAMPLDETIVWARGHTPTKHDLAQLSPQGTA